MSSLPCTAYNSKCNGRSEGGKVLSRRMLRFCLIETKLRRTISKTQQARLGTKQIMVIGMFSNTLPWAIECYTFRAFLVYFYSTT